MPIHLSKSCSDLFSSLFLLSGNSITFIIFTEGIAVEVEANSGDNSISTAHYGDTSLKTDSVDDATTSIFEVITNFILRSELSLAIIVLVLGDRTFSRATFSVPTSIGDNSRGLLVLNKSFCSSLSR